MVAIFPICLIGLLVGPLFAICLLLMFAPCFLRFIRSGMRKVLRVAISQMLLHPNTPVPTEPLPNLTLGQSPASAGHSQIHFVAPFPIAKMPE